MIHGCNWGEVVRPKPLCHIGYRGYAVVFRSTPYGNWLSSLVEHDLQRR